MSKMISVVMVVLVVMLMVVSGCSMELRGSAYYPKENQGDIYKSRMAENSPATWVWGEAGK